MNPAYFTARLRASSSSDGLPEAFAVITACNPEGKTISSGENAVRNEGFRRELMAGGYEHFPVTGYDTKSSHEEAGFEVVCDRETAWELGRRLKQEAIFYVYRGVVRR